MYGITFDPEKYKYWHTQRLYLEGCPPVPLDMWRSEEGEPRKHRVMAPAYQNALEDELQQAEQEREELQQVECERKAVAITCIVEMMAEQGISLDDLIKTPYKRG